MPLVAVASPASRRAHLPRVRHLPPWKVARRQGACPSPHPLQQRPLCPAPPTEPTHWIFGFDEEQLKPLLEKVSLGGRDSTWTWGREGVSLGSGGSSPKPHIPVCNRNLLAGCLPPRAGASGPDAHTHGPQPGLSLAAGTTGGLSGWPLAQNTPYALHRMFRS